MFTSNSETRAIITEPAIPVVKLHSQLISCRSAAAASQPLTGHLFHSLLLPTTWELNLNNPYHFKSFDHNHPHSLLFLFTICQSEVSMHLNVSNTMLIFVWLQLYNFYAEHAVGYQLPNANRNTIYHTKRNRFCSKSKMT